MRILAAHGAIFCACLVSAAGCNAYLHDDGLQTQTNTITEGFKAAAVPDALNGLITHQIQENAANVQAVIDRETALRESALAVLLAGPASAPPDGRFKATIDAFNATLDARAKTLAADSLSGLGPAAYANFVRVQAEVLAADSHLAALAQAYANAGGKDFKECNSFSVPGDAAGDQKTLGDNLSSYCQTDWQGSHRSLDDFNTRFHVTTGRLADAAASLAQTVAAIDAEKKAEDEQSKKLKDWQEAIDKKAASSLTGADLTADIKQLHTAIGAIDNGLRFANGSSLLDGESLGTALASVKFKTANLCDLVAAPSGTSCTGEPANPNAAATMAAITGLLNDLNARPDPSAAALQLVAAQGEGALLSRQLGYLKQRLAIQQDEVDKLRGEFVYLAAARKALNAHSKQWTADCAALSFEQLMTSANKCPADVRVDVALALVDYNYAWGFYPVAATVDFYQVSGQIRLAQIDTEIAAGNIRVQIAQSLLNTMQSYGQGGVKPETIAAFIQALGIPAAIAAKD